MNDLARLQCALQMILLLRRKYGINISQLSDRFDMSERNVYRYIKMFKEAGFVIEMKDGYYKLKNDADQNRDLSDLLHFSKEESWILQKAIHSVDGNNVLKESLVKKLYALYNSREVAKTMLKDQLGENIHLLCEAIDRKKQVLLKQYQSANSGKTADRHVEPFGFTSNYISVWCYDMNKNENRLFKTARVEEVVLLDYFWQNEKKHKATETDIFRISMKEKIGVRLKLSLRACNLLKEEYPMSEKFIKHEGNQRIFEGHVGSFKGIGRFVLGLMDEVEVLEPESFIHYLNEKIEKRTFKR